jgi:hypothetical protein
VTLGCTVHPAFRGICPNRPSPRLICDDFFESSQLVRSLLITLSVLLGGCAPELNWREWRTPEVGLTQLFPCKPVRQQRKIELAGRPVTMVLQVCDVADVSWAVAHAELGDPSAVGPALQMLAAAAHDNLGVPRSAPLAVPVQGATPQAAAGRFRFQGTGRDGRSLDEAVLVVARGTLVVQVTALGPRLADDGIETFLGSVRLGP